MDTPTLLSLLALVIAIFNRPLEVLWNKAFKVKQSYILWVVFIIIVIGCIYNIVHLMMFDDFNKRFIFLIAANFFNIAIGVTLFLNKRIVNKNYTLELKVKALETELNKEPHVEMQG
jgi:hypothetical protein